MSSPFDFWSCQIYLCLVSAVKGILFKNTIYTLKYVLTYAQEKLYKAHMQIKELFRVDFIHRQKKIISNIKLFAYLMSKNETIQSIKLQHSPNSSSLALLSDSLTEPPTHCTSLHRSSLPTSCLPGRRMQTESHRHTPGRLVVAATEDSRAAP